MNEPSPAPAAPAPDRERADLLAALAYHRSKLRRSARGLTEEQAAATPTVSALSIGGLVKHVAGAEQLWADFIVVGPSAFESAATGPDRFRLVDGESLAAVLEGYREVAALTSALVTELPDLDAEQPLPPAFEPGARWSARRSLLHILSETAQHAGHADIIRETLDQAGR